MGTTPSTTNKIHFTWNQGLAYIIGTPTLLFTPMVYWQYDQTLFGSSAMTKMFVITGVGGVISFALFAGRKRWLIGSLLGLVAGLGASGAHLLYTGIFHREMMYDKESALVCLAGAGVPMALLAYVLKRDKGVTNDKVDA